MSSFAQRCGIDGAQRQQSSAQLSRLLEASGVDLVRVAWCDLHGVTRGKALTVSAAQRALHEGISMVSTLMLKDTSDRTAFKVFEPGGVADLEGFGFANNVVLVRTPPLQVPASPSAVPVTPTAAVDLAER